MQIDQRDNRILQLTLAACAALALWSAGTREFHNLAMYGLLHADAQGYYGYLVAIFIEHSFDWEQVMAGYRQTYFDGGGADFTVMTEAGRVNKYYAGTAVLMLPFFLLSCTAAWLTGYPADGYSLPFQMGMMGAALTYVLSGLYLLGLYMRRSGLSITATSLSLFGVFAGTGLFFYTVFEPGMSHAYSFFLFCAFIFLADRAIQIPTQKNVLLLSVVLALIALVRPTNAIIVCSMPFIAGGLQPFAAFVRTVFRDGRSLGPAIIASVLIVAIQPLMYVLQVGRMFVWSYSGEGFNFLDPHIADVLFSCQKGLFVYYPWTFLALGGLVPLLFRNRSLSLLLLAFLGVSVYVVSSWWCWYYGSSFGMRAMIEYLPFFALLMANLLHGLKGRILWPVAAVGLLTVPVNLIQSYQYNKFILHWDSMDCERYRQVFLRTDRALQGVFYRKDPPVPDEGSTASRYAISTDLEELRTEWGVQGRTELRSSSGQYSSMLTTDNPYGTTIGIPWSVMGDSGQRVLVATFMVWSEVGMPELSLAYSFNAGDEHYGHTYLPLGNQVLEAKEWTKVRVVAEIPTPKSNDDVWIAYPYTTRGDTVFVDDISYELLTLKSSAQSEVK